MFGTSITLQVAGAVGAGTTDLAAFDDALLKIGVANFSLVRIKSVIPPGAHMVDCHRVHLTLEGDWGDRLYAVYAARPTRQPGEAAWAGIGWVQDDTGRGLLVEHSGHEQRRVRHAIEASLDQLVAGRGMTVRSRNLRIVGGTVVDRPICALVFCAYTTEGWTAPAR